MSTVIKIYPTVEECQINNKVRCHYTDCHKEFKSESNLNLHVLKTHERLELKRSMTEKQYYCPQPSCPWSNLKHFKNMKRLRHHYFKVHLEKKIICKNCQNSFVTEALNLKHLKFCNVEFKCLDCKASYGCYTTLQTHSRRKKHRILEKTFYSKKVSFDIPSKGIVLFGSSQRSENKQSLENNTTQVPTFSNFATQQTQTNWVNIAFSVETQTNNDFTLATHKDTFDYLKDINTQTDAVELKETSCNTSFNLDGFGMTFDSYVQKNSLSTQTCPGSQGIFSTSLDDSIQTETSDLYSDIHGTFNSNCKAIYDDYNNLKTSSRRKKNRIIEKNIYRKKSVIEIPSSIVCTPNQRLLLPKFEDKYKGGNNLGSKTIQVSTFSNFSTQETQTNLTNIAFSVETQTNDAFAYVQPNDTFDVRDNNTQTDVVELKETSCNTSFNLDDFGITFDNSIQKNSSSTQTCSHSQNVFDMTTGTHDSIRTNTSNLLSDPLGAFDSNFFNCNMETQTDLIFDGDLFNTEDYTSMCTQTCSEIFDGLTSLNNNQAQTIEGQTLMSNLDCFCQPEVENKPA